MSEANRWADPAGSATRPPRAKYRIRDAESGEVVERMTSLMADSATRRGAYFHSLDHRDLHMAKGARSILQRACAYFKEPDDAKYEPLEGVAFDWCGLPHCRHEREHHNGGACQLCEVEYCKGDEGEDEECLQRPMWEHAFVRYAVTDADVRERIERIDLGENSREADRMGLKRFPLQELPWDQQRALIEQMAAFYREWCFEWLGDATPEEEDAYAKNPAGITLSGVHIPAGYTVTVAQTGDEHASGGWVSPEAIYG